MKTAVLSDIHGNLPAFQAVLADIDAQGCEQIYILGDIINGMNPAESLGAVRSLGSRLAGCIKGNAELYLLTPNLDDLPGRDESENEELVRLIRWYQSKLADEEMTWLDRLPETIAFDGTIMAHDSPLDRLFKHMWMRPGLAGEYQEWFYHSPGIYEDMDPAGWQKLFDWMDQNGVTRVFCGHSHVPFLKKVDGKTVCNAGSAGFTLDGDPRPSWALLDGGEITLRRVEYDIDEALRRVESTPDYPSLEEPRRRRAYQKMLSTGLHWRVHLNS